MVRTKNNIFVVLLFFVSLLAVKQVFAVQGAAGDGLSEAATPVMALTLEDCITLALENNPGLQLEREKVSELESEYRIASSALYPRLSLSAYYQRLDSDRLGIPSNMLYSEETLALARLKQVVFDGGKSWNNRSAAIKGEEAQRISADTSRLDTILAVSQAYYRALEARELRKVSQTSLEQREAFFKLTEAFHKAGRATRVEFLKADAQLLDAERSLLLATEVLRLSELILKKVIAIDLGTPIEVANSLPGELPEPPAEDLVLQETLANNPDLIKVFTLKEQSEASLRAAQGQYWPEISLQGTYGFRERDSARDSEWTAGIFLEWPLFDGGLTRGQVGKARSKVSQISWSGKAVRDQVQVDLREALGNLKTALAAVKASRRLADAQEEAYQAVLAFYKRGKSTYVEVLAAQVDLTQAKASLVRAVGDYQNASSRLNRIRGKRSTPTT